MSKEENSNEAKNINEEEKEEKKENEEEEKNEDKEEEKKENEEEDKSKNKKKEEPKKEKKKKDSIKKDIKKENQILENKLNISKENKTNIDNIISNSNNLNNLNENNNFTSRFPVPVSTPFQSLQLLSNINNEMDTLSKTLNTKFSLYSLPSPSTSLYNQDFNFNYNLNSNLNSNFSPSFLNSNYNYNNYNNYYDKEDFEIKELLIKANKIINDNEIKLKLNNNNLFNNNNNGGVKKFENKITQYEENIFKNENNSNNISINNNSDNNLNTNYDFYKDKNNNYPDHIINNNLHSMQQNTNNIFHNKYSNNYMKENYYQDRKQKSINNGFPLLNKKDFFNNNFEINNNNRQNDNISFKKYQDYNKSKSQRNEGNSIDISINNKTKKIEDLYKYTNNPRRKPMVYTQPESLPLNKISSRNRNISTGNSKFKDNNGKLPIERDSNKSKKNSFLRSENEEINRAIDILNGKI